ncbi:hypothetical protein DRE_06676 [Drechslerella stenobrocha 248]|uniref:Uncharacterized protein n=1 Tax=Drechslerella stenobrocha 248 TaxID=1043628 RepID=W7I6T6_9PEZI|nr:hypothetical protein DRE_06676 [Drechslerella stenobrocha 248]
MADATYTKAPAITKLNPKTRLLSYTLRASHLTAPAQYYPCPLPRVRVNTTQSAKLQEGSQGETATAYPSDRSIVVYGTKTGLTILYPRRIRHCGAQHLRAASAQCTDWEEIGANSDVEMAEDGDCVVYEHTENGPTASPHAAPGFDSGGYETDYESHSGSEEYSFQRNIGFPWKYSIDLDSAVTEFALPRIPDFVDEQSGPGFRPWLLQKVYITAITEDGAVRLIVLPFRLPPPGVSSTRHISPEFPVNITHLKHGIRGQTRPRGICLGLLQRLPYSVGSTNNGQIYIWNAEILPNGQIGRQAQVVGRLQRFNTSEIAVDLHYLGDVTSVENPSNTLALHIVHKLNGLVKVLHLDPFEGGFKEKVTLWTPTKGETQYKFGESRSLPFYLESRKKILAIQSIFHDKHRGGRPYELWTILEDGKYGHWDMAAKSPRFQQCGYCSKGGVPQPVGRSEDEVGHSASIVFSADFLYGLNLRDIYITRYDNVLRINGPEGESFELVLGNIFNRDSNQLSCSSFVDPEGTRRLLMTQMPGAYTILEYNLSKNLSKAYFQRDEDGRQIVDPWEVALEARRAKTRAEMNGWKEMEELARHFQRL